jgi:hypothetical protein
MSRQCQRLWAVVVMLVVVLAVAESASAQGGRGSFRRLFGVAKAQLATLPEVQTDLKMTDEQKTRVAEINDQLGEDRRALWGTSFGRYSEIRGDLEKLNTEASANLDKVLDESQRKRLQEISIQQNGARSLHEDDVIAALNLSDEQQAKLKTAGEENSKAIEKAFSEGGRENWRERAGELAEQSDKRLLGVLTDEQKTKFEAMKGTELAVDLSPIFRRGRGPR